MASALADWRAIRSGSVFRPRSASQASNGPGMPPPLEQAGSDGVVHHHGRARRGRQRAEAGQVGHPQQRVGRRLGPQHRRPGGQRALDRGQVPQVHEDRAGAVRPQPVRQHPAPVVAVLRQHDALTPRGQRQHQGHRGGLARGEGHRLGVLQAAERLLESFPARVAVPAVAAARARGALRHVDARRSERRRRGLARYPLGTGVDQPGFGGERLSHRSRSHRSLGHRSLSHRGRRMLQYNL